MKHRLFIAIGLWIYSCSSISSCPDPGCIQKDTAKQCFPPCRPGYVCHPEKGECVDMCNPPCPDGMVCVDGDCVLIKGDLPAIPESEKDVNQVEQVEEEWGEEDIFIGEVEEAFEEFEEQKSDENVEGEIEDGSDIQGGSCPNHPSCIFPVQGQPDVPIVLFTKDPPTLNGGNIVSGHRDLLLVEVYNAGTFSNMASYSTAKSNGNTFGSVLFSEEEFGVYVNLDLSLGISTVFLGDISAGKVLTFKAGGCMAIQANKITSDLLKCSWKWPFGSALPSAIEYESSQETLKLLVVLGVDTVKDLIPSQFDNYKEMLVSGGMKLLLVFGPATSR